MSVETAVQEVPIKAFLGDICYVTPGVIDEASIDIFTNGQCHSLAVALQRRHGYPIFLIAISASSLDEYFDDDEHLIAGYSELPDEVIVSLWRHAVVLVDEAKDIYLDITGLHTGNDLFLEWFGYPSSPEAMCYFVPSSEEQLARLVESYGGIELDVEVADLFINAVVASLHK